MKAIYVSSHIKMNGMKTVLFGKRKDNSREGKEDNDGDEYEQIMMYTHEHIIMKPITVHVN